MPIGGNHFTRALTKELKLTFAKAEHLKRNATKAQDPRAVFTAMRGIFNDFSSEVSRSIGFYSSVNRNAKIVKIVGLGNGFKLPGLQKFLQQNLNQDVERLESFPKLVGDEVLTAPQFQENLASFPVAYGLAVQGLGSRPDADEPAAAGDRAGADDPPQETLGAGGLDATDARLLGHVHQLVARPGQDQAVRGAGQAGPECLPSRASAISRSSTPPRASSPGSSRRASRSSARRPSGRTGRPCSRRSWPPCPTRARNSRETVPGFEPNDPKFAPLIGILRVHVDKIVPAWREDLKAAWFDELDQRWVDTMHAFDREKPPEGAGWVIQIVGHHYNPSPLGRKKELEEAPLLKKYALGPWPYIQYQILPRFFNPVLRLAGIHHAALTWFTTEQKWTTEMGASAVPLPPMLAKEQPKTEACAGGMPGAEGMPGMGQMQAMMGMMGGKGMEAAGEGMPGMPGMPGMGGCHGEAGNDEGMMGMGMPKSSSKDVTTLTRTDFKIEFVWQPPKPEEAPKTPEEVGEKLTELRKSMSEAAEKSKGSVRAFDESKLLELSLKESEEAKTKAIQQIQEQLKKSAPAAGQPAAEGAQPAEPAGGPGGGRRRYREVSQDVSDGRWRPFPPGPPRPPDPRARPLATRRVSNPEPNPSLTPRRGTTTMDQVKEYLGYAIKYRFWIVVGIACLLPLIGYFASAGAIEEEAKKQSDTIKSSFDEVKKFASNPSPVNNQYKPIVEQKTEILNKDVNASWRKLFDRQAELLTWPEDVADRFPVWGPKWPEGQDRIVITQALTDYVESYEDYYKNVYQTVQPFDYESGEGIVAAPPAQALLRPPAFTITDPPTLSEVWDTQRKFWVQRTVLDVIAKVNERADAKDWQTAPGQADSRPGRRHRCGPGPEVARAGHHAPGSP